MAILLVSPVSEELMRSLPFAQTTPSGTTMPATVGSSPKVYFNQFGTPSPTGVALGAALGLLAEPKYWICQESGRVSLLASPVRSAIEAFSRPTAYARL